MYVSSDMNLFLIIVVATLLNRATCWVPTVSRKYSTLQHHLHASRKPISKEMELAIKMKRLKQLNKEGKDYKAFIVENARIEEEKDGKSDEEKAELQNKIVEYKEEIDSSKHPRPPLPCPVLFAYKDTY